MGTTVRCALICIKTRNWAQYLWTWRQSAVPNDAPRDFGPEVAFGAKFQITVARQGGREMSALDHVWQIPFVHSDRLVIISNYYIIYIENCIRYFFHVVRTMVAQCGQQTTSVPLFCHSYASADVLYTEMKGAESRTISNTGTFSIETLNMHINFF